MDLDGETIGQFQIIEQVGRGGMATVYKAYQANLQRYVAIKVLSPKLTDDVDLVERFGREARSAAKLHHPNVIVIHDVGSEGDIHYIVSEFLEGMTLAQLLEQTGAMSPERVLNIVRQIASALDYAHREELIHRDIKPSNIMVNPERDDHVTLMDFGLVRMAGGSKLTRTGFIMGTPDYMSPEQAKGDEIDHRTDIYSLGITVFHMLTGEVPFEKPTPHAVLLAHIMEDPPPLTLPDGRVSPEIEAVVHKSMAKAPEDRYGRAGDLAGDMEMAIRSPAAFAESLVGAPTPIQPSPAVTPVSQVPPSGPPAQRQTPPRGAVPYPPGPAARGTPYPPVRAPSAVAPPARRRWIWPVVALATFAVLTVLAIAAILLYPTIARLVAGIGTPTPVVSVPTLEPTPTTQQAVEPTFTPTTQPTATPTEEPTTMPAAETPALSATETPTLPPTETPTVALTETFTPRPPTATPTPPPTDTSTPEPTVGPPTATPTATKPAAPPPPPSSGVLISFEQWGTWKRGDQPYGELTQTQEQVRSGNYAAKLSYDFPKTSDDFVVFASLTSIGGSPNTVSAWVYGDGSGHYVNIWIQDAQNQVWSVHLGKVGRARWQQMSGKIDPARPWPSGHVFGPNNGVVDYPIRFYGIVLDRPGSGPQSGQIYIDDISVSQAGSTVDQTPTTSAGGTGQIGHIVFTVQSGGGYALYSVDLNWDKMVKIGDTDWENSTCTDSNTARTFDGTVIHLHAPQACFIAGTVDSCPSPNGQYKVNTNRKGDDYQVTLRRVSDNHRLEPFYQGSLNIHPGINWAPDSSHFLFTVHRTVYRGDINQPGHKQIIPFKHDTWPAQYTPDGAWLYYPKPVQGEIDDICVIRPDGSSERNLTHSTVVDKMCPRWRQ